MTKKQPTPFRAQIIFIWLLFTLKTSCQIKPHPAKYEVDVLLQDGPDDGDDDIYSPEVPQSKSQIKCEEYSVCEEDYSDPSILALSHSNEEVVPLIFGGSPAEADEFPFMAAIGNDEEWWCGGSLISKNFVLTAAHCVFSRNGLPTKVKLGDVDLNAIDIDVRFSRTKPVGNMKSSNAFTGIEIRISKTIAHPNYKKPVKYNDIALVQLEKSVKFSDSIRPICLWVNPILHEMKAIATGWGLSEENSGVTAFTVLQKVTLDVFPNSKCNALYNFKDVLPGGVDNTLVCAGDAKGVKDTCQGDSGGPLLVKKRKNGCELYIIGVTSFGTKCGGKVPALYTKVSEFVDWIEDNVWK